MGSSLTYKNSPRAFLNQTQVFLGGTVYGTSTRALGPGGIVEAQTQTQGGTQGQVQGASDTQSTGKAPTKYVPWTPAP